MALVRRSTAARDQVPAGAAAPTIPHQGAPGGAPAGAAVAAAAPTRPASLLAVVMGLGFPVVGALAAMSIDTMLSPPVFRVSSQMSVFAGLFVFAAAVERLLEPFTRWLPGRGAQERFEQAMADMDNGVPGATNAAAAGKAAVSSARASRAIVLWGVATLVATVLSAAGGFYLLRLISADPSWSAIPTWLDALITGLVVGTGTKPLHDILSRMQRPPGSPNATA